jgi:hypothetical protein
MMRLIKNIKKNFKNQEGFSPVILLVFAGVIAVGIIIFAYLKFNSTSQNQKVTPTPQPSSESSKNIPTEEIVKIKSDREVVINRYGDYCETGDPENCHDDLIVGDTWKDDGFE